MKRICLLLLVSVLVTLIVAPISPTVNSSPTPALNPDSQQAQGWPIPPPPPRKVRSAEKDLMAQGWPIPPPPPKSKLARTGLAA